MLVCFSMLTLNINTVVHNVSIRLAPYAHLLMGCPMWSGSSKTKPPQSFRNQGKLRQSLGEVEVESFFCRQSRWIELKGRIPLNKIQKTVFHLVKKSPNLYYYRMLKINVSLQRKQQQKIWAGFSIPQKETYRIAFFVLEFFFLALFAVHGR